MDSEACNTRVGIAVKLNALISVDLCLVATLMTNFADNVSHCELCSSTAKCCTVSK